MRVPDFPFTLILFPVRTLITLLPVPELFRISLLSSMCCNTGNTFVILTMESPLVVFTFNNVLQFETSYVAFLPADWAMTDRLGLAELL